MKLDSLPADKGSGIRRLGARMENDAYTDFHYVLQSKGLPYAILSGNKSADGHLTQLTMETVKVGDDWPLWFTFGFSIILVWGILKHPQTVAEWVLYGLYLAYLAFLFFGPLFSAGKEEKALIACIRDLFPAAAEVERFS